MSEVVPGGYKPGIHTYTLRSIVRVTINSAHSVRAGAKTRAKPKCDRSLSRALHTAP
jgi:hypothetical protein